MSERERKRQIGIRDFFIVAEDEGYLLRIWMSDWVFTGVCVETCLDFIEFDSVDSGEGKFMIPLAWIRRFKILEERKELPEAKVVSERAKLEHPVPPCYLCGESPGNHPNEGGCLRWRRDDR